MDPGGVQEMTGHGTRCSGLVNMVVLGQRLDLILGVFSILNYSTILLFFSYIQIRDTYQWNSPQPILVST